jgi:hypothetical protein
MVIRPIGNDVDRAIEVDPLHLAFRDDRNVDAAMDFKSESIWRVQGESSGNE